jgi:Tol biopolymer transport system component
MVPFEGQVETAYDYSPATRRLLHGRFTGRGAGPGNIAVTDLRVLDLNSGADRQLIAEENIAEAVWAPDGQNLAYVRATPTTYELRWLTALGEDRRLASDVAFTFSVSPSRDEVAFTRESRYNVEGQPGLYVVEVDSSQERLLSDTDRAGFGSISDRPIWSPDGTQILLLVSSQDVPTRILRAAADGASADFLTFTASLEPEISPSNLGNILLWHPDNRHLVGQIFPGMLGGEPRRIYLFELSPALDQIIAAEIIYEGEGELIGWDQPGITLWIRVPDNQLQRLSLIQRNS